MQKEIFIFCIADFYSFIILISFKNYTSLLNYEILLECAEFKINCIYLFVPSTARPTLTFVYYRPCWQYHPNSTRVYPGGCVQRKSYTAPKPHTFITIQDFRAKRFPMPVPRVDTLLFMGSLMASIPAPKFSSRTLYLGHLYP